MAIQTRGVVLIGMHRSGTSAVARAINLLGLSVGDPARLIPPVAENPKGFWENAELSEFNEDLLEFLGGTWSGPPRLSEGWIRDSRLDPFRERARVLFESVYEDERWIWKDPRNCLTLPFWIDALELNPIVVFVVRSPLEISESLRERNCFSKVLSLALWERYLREAIGAVTGLPVLVVAYAELLEHPRDWWTRSRDFLRSYGIPAGSDDDAFGLLAEFLDVGLRHSSATDRAFEDDPDVSEPQRRLHRSLTGRLGAHGSFAPLELGAEAPSTEPLIAERRRADLGEKQRVRERREKETLIAEVARLQLELTAVLPSRNHAIVSSLKARHEEIRRRAQRVECQLEACRRTIGDQAIRNGELVVALDRIEREISVERRDLVAERSRLRVVSESTAYLLAHWLRRIRIRFAPSGTRRDRLAIRMIHCTAALLHDRSARLEFSAVPAVPPMDDSASVPIVIESLDLPTPESVHWGLLEVEGRVRSCRAPVRLVLAYLDDRCLGEIQLATPIGAVPAGAVRFHGLLPIDAFGSGAFRLTIRIMDELGNVIDQHRSLSISPAAAGLSVPPGREIQVSVEELMERVTRVITKSEIDAWFDDVSNER